MTAKALAVTGFSGAVARTNAAGKEMGQRVAFLNEFPAGDVRKALKEANPQLKGKELTKAVDKVLRGDAAMPWVLLDATVSAARSMGFVPLVGDVNKAGDKLTLKFQKPQGAIDKDTALHAAQNQLTDEELLAIIEQRKKAAAAAPAGDKPAINV